MSDSDPGMLRYLAERGIAFGDRLEVLDRQPFGGPVFVRFGGRELPLGGELARAMRIERRADSAVSVRRRPPVAALRGPSRAPRSRCPTLASASRARSSSCSRRVVCVPPCGCSGRRSSPRSPTSTRATSRPTWRAVPRRLPAVVGRAGANLMAMLIQYLSAKLGIITDRNLPEVVRERFPRGSPGGCGCRPR